MVEQRCGSGDEGGPRQRVVAPGPGVEIVGALAQVEQASGAPVWFHAGDVVLRTADGLGRVVGWTPTPGGGTSDFAPPSAIVEDIDEEGVKRLGGMLFPPVPFEKAHVVVWAYQPKLHDLYPEAARLPAGPVVARGAAGVIAVLVADGPALRHVRATWAAETFLSACGLIEHRKACVVHAEVAFSFQGVFVPECFALLAYAYQGIGDAARSVHIRGLARRLGDDFAARTNRAYNALLEEFPLPNPMELS